MSAVGAAIAGGLISSAGQLLANQQTINANAARFGEQTDLANSAHQREVLDLIKAGLNPVLSASGSGASVPSLGAPEVGSITETLGSQINTAGRLAALDIPLKESQVELNSAQAANLYNDGYLKKVQADMVRRGTNTIGDAVNSAETVGDKVGGFLGTLREKFFDHAHKSPVPVDPIRKREVKSSTPSLKPKPVNFKGHNTFPRRHLNKFDNTHKIRSNVT